jgi:DNA polymerase-3 subunit alpha/error-prone DNA polymerase
MRGLLRRLKCDNYKILVAVPPSYVRCGAKWYDEGVYFRHNHPDQFEYFHETFKEHLGETYGVMVYQEDVIKLLHFAGVPAYGMFCVAR